MPKETADGEPYKPGQTKELNMEAADTEALITFYETLYEQRPDSRMAQEFMVKHGLLEWDEAEKVNKKLLKGGGKSSGGGGSSSKSKAKANDDDDFQKSKSKGKGKAPAKKPSPKPSIPQEDSSDVRAAAFFHSSRRTLSSRTHLTLASRLASQEEFDAKPAAKSKKGNGKAPAPAPKPAAKRKSIEPEPDSSDDEEDTPIAQKKKAKTSAAPAKKTAPAKKKGKKK